MSEIAIEREQLLDSLLKNPKPFPVSVKSHWYGGSPVLVQKITAKWVVVICNEIATCRFSRKDGYSSGAFRDRQSLPPSKVVDTSLAFCNDLANRNGGTWDSGWRKKKRKES